MKYVGVADGVALAAVIELGKLVPSLTWTVTVAQVLGLVGTIVGGLHMSAASKVKP
jgi:hypothetical protein